jgi:glyoxylase-like metal-dependent hydrolase (beta-lactamase superfamily II)
MQIFPGVYVYFSDKLVTSLLGRGATCNCYALASEHELWLIDPPGNNRGMMARFLHAVQKDHLDINHLTRIYLTHAHPDHMAGLEYFYSHYSPNIIVHTKDLDVVKGGYPAFWNAQLDAAGDLTPEFFFAPFPWIQRVSEFLMGSIAPIPNATSFSEEETLQIGSIAVKIVHTPGHSPGHVSFYLPDFECLIAGDIFGLFGDHKPVLNLPYSDLDAYQKSLEKLKNLPITHLVTGHKRQWFSERGFYQDLVRGTLKNCELARSLTYNIVKNQPGIRI